VSLLLVLSSLQCGKATKETIQVKVVLQPQRADFRIALKYVLDHEGFWVHHPNDYGQETYRGIARRFNSEWLGWKYVDEYKRHNRIKWNDSIPDPMLYHYVLDYYLTIWVKEDFMNLKDQDIANYVLDFRINGTVGAAIVQTTLCQMGYTVEITNCINSQTIEQLNKVNKWEFLVKLMNNRIDFYTNIVDRKSSQIIFLNHWIKRVKV